MDTFKPELWLLDVDNDFTHHTPKPGQPEKYKAIRDKAKELAILILETCPAVMETSSAYQRLNEVVFLANAAIARHGD